MGPFEMLESIGLDNFFSKIGSIDNNPFLENLTLSLKMKRGCEVVG